MQIRLQSFNEQQRYAIDSVPNNPPLIVYRGDRIELDIDTVGHPIVIKTAPGIAHGNSYRGFLPGPNGMEFGRVGWEVAQDAPPQLFYQSLNDPSLLGVVLVKTKIAPDSFRYIDEDNLDGLSVSELVDIINHNTKTALSKASDLAGYGLKWDGVRFSLADGFTAYEDDKGFYTSERIVYVNDQMPRDSSPGLGIAEVINQLASQLRRIINPNDVYSAQPADSINGLLTQLQNFEIRIESLGVEYGRLKNDYEALLKAYQDLVFIYAKHQHAAQDIVAGVLKPERIGFGPYNNDSVLRGGFWAND